MQANTLAVRLFLVTWASYLIAKAAWSGGTAEANCHSTFAGDDAQYYRLCTGYSAAATFDVFGALCSLVAAASASREWWKTSVFLLSLSFYALGVTCEYGGESSSIGAHVPDDDVSVNEEEYFSAATVFYFFAAAFGIVASAYASKTMAWQSLVSFNLFLGTLSLGMLCVQGGKSKTAYDALSNSYQDTNNGKNVVIYHGYGFAAFCSAMGFAVGYLFAIVTYRNRETISRVWICWFAWSFIVLLGLTTAFSTESEVYCKNSSSAHHEYLCNGFTAAAFFSSVSVVASILGLVFAIKEKDTMKHSMLLVSFGLWSLAYGCYQGGESKYFCVTATSTDDYYQDQCKGYGVGTFFDMIAFVFAIVGAYFAHRGGGGRNDVLHVRVDEEMDSDT